MLIKLLFWALVALDVAAVALWVLLGLAAAGSDGSDPIVVLLLLGVLPLLPLAAAVLVFVFARSRIWRGAAVVLVAAPLLIVAGSQAWLGHQLALHSDAAGTLTFFRPGPQRDLVEAIRRNDAGAVIRLAPQVDLDAAGMAGMTPLIAALRQLRITPERPECLYALIEAGADPDIGTDYEQPLEMALQLVGRAGIEPVRRLLAAGADPNRRNGFGTPVWFAGIGVAAGPDTLALLLDAGADPAATGPNDETALIVAARARLWRSAQLLLERGVDPARGRSIDGLTFAAMIEAEAGRAAGEPGFAALLDAVRQLD
jgi:hypothetical protein